MHANTLTHTHVYIEKEWKNTRERFNSGFRLNKEGDYGYFASVCVCVCVCIVSIKLLSVCQVFFIEYDFFSN